MNFYRGLLQFANSAVIIANVFGLWLSLVEHRVRDAGVAGSNPVNPTNTEIIRRELKTSAFRL